MGKLRHVLIRDHVRLWPENGPGRRWAAYVPREDEGLDARVRALVDCLGDARSTAYLSAIVREEAAHALGELGWRARPALPALAARLDRDLPSVRAAAARALGLLGDRSAVPRLEAHAHDPDPVVRRAVAEALACLGTQNPKLLWMRPCIGVVYRSPGEEPDRRWFRAATQQASEATEEERGAVVRALDGLLRARAYGRTRARRAEDLRGSVLELVAATLDQAILTLSRARDEMSGRRPSRGPADGRDRGETPLHIAALLGLNEVVAMLLREGADPNVGRFSDAWTPLHAAALAGHADIVDALLAHGADPDGTHPTMHESPLHVAAEQGHVGVVERLLAAGCDPEAPSPGTGVTALRAAMAGGHVGVVRAMLTKR